LRQAGAEGDSAGGASPAFDEAHRRLLADSSIQFELKPFQPPEVPGWLRWLIEALGDGGPAFRILFWAAAAALLLFILYRAAGWASGGGLDRFRSRRAAGGAEEVWQPEEAPARALLGEADALAQAGRYSEAARLILHRSIEDIEARRPQTVRPALTGRDIAAVPSLPPEPRSALARIVTLVERGLFAARPLSAEDWARCRSAYEAFAFGPGWRA
jgi:hypothetical protein